MSSGIAPINLPAAPNALAELQMKPREAVAPEGATDFAHAFTHAISQSRELEGAAQTASEQFANGDPKMGIHEVMIATEKSSLALRYATTLKNKALEAYRELMNTQV